VQLIPFQDMRQSASWKLSSDHAVLDSNRDLELTVESVEVGRLVFPVEHGDHDSEKATNLRHGILPHYFVISFLVALHVRTTPLAPALSRDGERGDRDSCERDEGMTRAGHRPQGGCRCATAFQKFLCVSPFPARILRRDFSSNA
jgi:hypothetical protein